MSGGTGFSGFLTRAARSVLENALNSTANANNGTSGSGIQISRSFFDLGGSDTSDGGVETVIEYAGRAANTEIAEIYPISLRAGDLILHGPRKEQPDASYGTYTVYNIILHATNANSSSERMYSLFRTDSEPEASRMFVIYKQIFPDLVKASTSSLDTKALERIIKMSRKHESYAATHIAAALSMVDQLKHPALRDKLMEQEGKELHTALHVACIHAKLDAFKAISEDEKTFDRVYDYEDNKGNNICHMAANCKDKTVGAGILKILKEKLIVNQTGSKRASCTRSLLQLFMKLNNEGKAPIHLACEASNKEAVELLVDVTDLSVAENNVGFVQKELTTVEGYTLPASDRVNLLNIKAAATGSTPLHLVTSDSELLSHLLSSGSDPNITDNDGLTPLHKAVLQSNLKSTLQLLANGAFPDFTATYENFSEATALHLAASVCAVDCIKALIVFGADLEVRDGNGHTARHIVACVSSASVSKKQDALFVLAAAGAKRCTLSLVRGGSCSEGCKTGGRNNGKKPETWLIKSDGTTPSSEVAPGLLVHEAMRGLGIVRESYDSNDESSGDQLGPVVGGRLLSLDGGGIRGLVLTQMLFFIEKEFGNISGGGSPIISYFDWVAGTSTGGILALALASGKSVLETQSLYMKLKDKVFTGDRPYSATRMEEFLKWEFGADRKMSSIQKPKVMIMTALANRRPPDLYIFRNYVSPSCLLGDPEEYAQFPDDTYIWEAAKVTGAAPSFFTLDHELFIDGGLISNNPTLDALSELVQFKAVMMGSQHRVNGRGNSVWKLPSMVVSLGTGIPPKVESRASNLDIGWPTGVFDAIRNAPRVSHLVNLLVDQATQSEGQVVERARAWCTSIGVPFFRFSPQMSADIGLDEKQDDVLINLMWETWCYMVGHRGEIKEIFERLRDLDVGCMTSPGRSDFMNVSQ